MGQVSILFPVYIRISQWEMCVDPHSALLNMKHVLEKDTGILYLNPLLFPVELNW